MKKTSEPGVFLTSQGKYRIRVTAKCPKTRRRKDVQTTMHESATMSDAIALREKLRGEVISELGGAVLSRDRQTITVGDYADIWLERKKRKLKPSTVQKNVGVLVDWILPSIGHIPLHDLHRRDISDWIAWAEQQCNHSGELYSSEYVVGWWRVLRNMLRDAYAQGYIDHDVTLRHSPPDTGVGGRRESRTLTYEQVDQLVSTAMSVYPSRAAEIATLAYTGMRPGEMYALTWQDIDFDKRCIQVSKSVWRGMIGPPKNGKKREVPMLDELAEIIQLHASRCDYGDGIVFPSECGTYRYPSSIRKTLSRLSEYLTFDIKVTPQVLRRSLNTLLAIEGGVDWITLQSIMGHSSNEMTAHYSHVSLTQKLSAVRGKFRSTCGTSCGTSHQKTDIGSSMVH